jgi:hypothetical protein
VLQPRSFEQRQEVAHTCSAKLDIRFPVLIDGIENSTERAYTAWPDRLYIVAQDGTIAYKSRPGPAGFKARELVEALGNIFTSPVPDQ